jgi:hypothetical protein
LKHGIYTAARPVADFMMKQGTGVNAKINKEDKYLLRELKD